MHRPSPADRRVDDLDDPFWAACRAGRLLVQRCLECGRAYGPASSCVAHGGQFMRWSEATGRGRLESHSMIRGTGLPWFSDRTPYVVAVVRLDEDVLMHSTVVGCGPGELFVGMPVEVEFEDLEDGERLPRFRPIAPRELT